MQKLSSKNWLSFYALIFLFRILLEISYFNVVAPHFSYQGFKTDFNILNYLVSWGVFLVTLTMVRDRITRVSDYFFITALLAVVTPLTVLYGYDQERSLIPVLYMLFALLIIYSIVRIKLISFKSLPTVKNGLSIAVWLSTIFVAFLVFWYYLSGVNLNLNFLRVYEFRADNAELAAGGILGYTNNWTYKIFSMVLFAVALMYRRYMLVLFIFLIQVYFFAASAHKGVLFLPLLVFGIWYYFRKTNSLLILPLAFSGIILLTLLTYFIFDSLFASSFFSRRVFFVPANLTFVYFDFFSYNPHVLWSNSVLASFLSYPYEASMAKVIGGYLGNENMGANNGFVASGFAHAGFLGVFIYALIIGFLLRIINDITYNALPLWFAVSLSVIPLRSLLMSSDLFTVMLTHGFIVALIIIFLSRSKKYAQY